MTHPPVEPIWEPDPAALDTASITSFIDLVTARTGMRVAGYQDLWRWSVENLEEFWRAVWDHYDVQADGDPHRVLAEDRMPGAIWFPGVSLNYAEHALRRGADPALAGTTAVTAIGEDGATTRLTWGGLRDRVGALAGWLRSHGVTTGDRVVGYLPNTEHAVVAFLATASIGAVWSACAQDYSAQGAAGRLGQLEPVVLFAADGYRWNGRQIDRRDEVAHLRSDIPSLRATVLVPNLGLPIPESMTGWDEAVATPAEPVFERVPFDAPLWVLFSSGTTGLPKGIVHGHGGVLLEHLKLMGLQMDIGPGRTLFWYTSTNWMMWNMVASGLVLGATVVLYDGNPAFPDPGRLWRVAADEHVHLLGVSPGYLQLSARNGLHPGRDHDLSALSVVGVTGAPVSAAAYHWVHDNVGPRVQLASNSGGTDIVSGFAGSAPNTPVWPGEISAPNLGVALAAWDDEGRPVVGQVGELVVTRPMPSMPVSFWNDPDGSRYREAYFSAYPGVWRHGDWMEQTERGSVIVSGRSDSTLNRNGVRLGSADIYAALDLCEVVDSLVVGAELADGAYWLALFVVLADGVELTQELNDRIVAAIRTSASPRHVPDDVIAVRAIPHTRTGKKLEVPVKRLIQGHPLERVAGRDSVDDYEALLEFRRFARRATARP